MRTAEQNRERNNDPLSKASRQFEQMLEMFWREREEEKDLPVTIAEAEKEIDEQE